LGACIESSPVVLCAMCVCFGIHKTDGLVAYRFHRELKGQTHSAHNDKNRSKKNAAKGERERKQDG